MSVFAPLLFIEKIVVKTTRYNAIHIAIDYIRVTRSGKFDFLWLIHFLFREPITSHSANSATNGLHLNSKMTSIHLHDRSVACTVRVHSWTGSLESCRRSLRLVGWSTHCRQRRWFCSKNRMKTGYL